MKRIHNTVRSCTYTACPRGILCPNFSPRMTKNNFSFPSCMYNPIYITSKLYKANNANK